MAKRQQNAANGASECGTVGVYAVPLRMGFECYYNRDGDIVIIQECQHQGECAVILSKYEASRLVEALQALVPGARD